MVVGRVSHKRRRSWLELGVAGCSLLVYPAQAASGSLGTVWANLLDASSGDPRRHPGTADAFLRGSPSPPYALAAAVLPPASRKGDGLRRVPAQQQSRRLANAGGGNGNKYQAASGDWSDCTSDCTQTRAVVCETLDLRIVADHLCGDGLPEAEQACEIGACSAAVRGAPEAQAGEDTRIPSLKNKDEVSPKKAYPGSPAPGRVGVPRYGDSSGVSAHGEDGHSGSARGGVAHEREGVDTRGVKSAPGGNGAIAEASETTRYSRPGVDAANSAPAGGSKGLEAGGTGERLDGSSSSGGGGGPVISSKVKAGVSREKEAEDGEGPAEPVHVSLENGERGTDTPDSAPRRQKQSPEKTGPSGGKPYLAAQGSTEHTIDRIGNSPGLGREEYRFWIVLAIGAGAVGSFMAVVVFAVGQYRKERHRLRGIMALNEFPQDNYINPFARQVMSDDDREAFNL